MKAISYNQRNIACLFSPHGFNVYSVSVNVSGEVLVSPGSLSDRQRFYVTFALLDFFVVECFNLALLLPDTPFVVHDGLNSIHDNIWQELVEQRLVDHAKVFVVGGIVSKVVVERGSTKITFFGNNRYDHKPLNILRACVNCTLEKRTYSSRLYDIDNVYSPKFSKFINERLSLFIEEAKCNTVVCKTTR